MLYIKLKKTIYRKNKLKKIYQILLVNVYYYSFYKIGSINMFLRKININLRLFTKIISFNFFIKSKLLYNKIKIINNFFIYKKYEKIKY